MTDYPNLDKMIRINFFSGSQKRNSRSKSQIICAHLGTLVYNGYNTIGNRKIRRIKHAKCNKRFGNDVIAWNLLQYQQKIKKKHITTNLIESKHSQVRSLYKYLMKYSKKKEVGYRILENKRNSVQTVLSAFE